MAALREAYEEASDVFVFNCYLALIKVVQSGYHAKFMRVYNPSWAPAPPGREDLYSKPNTEPFYVTTFAWKETNMQLEQDPEANLCY